MKLYDNDAYRDKFIHIVCMVLDGSAAAKDVGTIITAFDSIPSVDAEPLLSNGPLTLEELREMNGEPVYLPKEECYALVTFNGFALDFTFADGSKNCYWFGPAYRRKPKEDENEKDK